MARPKEVDQKDRRALQPIITSYEKTKKDIEKLAEKVEDAPEIKTEIQEALIAFILNL